MEEPKVVLVNGISKKTKKPYQAIGIVIGDWSKLIFPESRFEMDYVKSLGTLDEVELKDFGNRG